MTTYVHYGSDHFIPDLFIPVRNAGWMEGGWRPKPADGTGLWASRENDERGWEAWCREAKFNVDQLRHSFRFTLSDASILELSDPDQLIDLPKLHPWEPKKVSWLETIKPGEIPTIEQLQELYMPNWCYLDFEKEEMKKRAEDDLYLAITLKGSGKVIGEIFAHPEGPDPEGEVMDTFSPCWMLNLNYTGKPTA